MCVVAEGSSYPPDHEGVEPRTQILVQHAFRGSVEVGEMSSGLSRPAGTGASALEAFTLTQPLKLARLN